MKTRRENPTKLKADGILSGDGCYFSHFHAFSSQFSSYQKIFHLLQHHYIFRTHSLTHFSVDFLKFPADFSSYIRRENGKSTILLMEN
jgi:hypothetical protein